MIRKAKTSAKMFLSDKKQIKKIVLNTMGRISDIVGSSLGPGGKNTLIESDYPGIPNKNTKDGVTIFKSLGANSPYEHLIIEQTRDSAQRTATEAGDGTTTTTILSAALVERLYEFTEKNTKYSPQKAAREMSKIIRTELVPLIQQKAIKIDVDNQDMLKMVAKISANGDEDMASAVIEAFETIGYGDSSHVTIKEVNGPYGYKVEAIEGFPIGIGFEDSAGKFHTAFINDQANQKCHLEKPLFLLYDGIISDLVVIKDVLERLGEMYVNGHSEFKNLVIFAHGFGDNVLTQLAYNFANPGTLNVVPMITPMRQFANSQLQFLMDLSAFTNAKIFNMTTPVNEATYEDLGSNVDLFEAYRFRSTVVAQPDQLNIDNRADELKIMKEQADSEAEQKWLEERLGKLTSGIAKLTIYGGSNGELKEAHDRCEDAVCAVRSAITKGALPGGCRTFLDLALYLENKENKTPVESEIIIPALMTPIIRLLDNAGHTEEEASKIIEHLLINTEDVYDIENQQFGKPESLGIFDAAPAVEESLKNASSIAQVMGTIGGLVAFPRDEQFERAEAMSDSDFMRASTNPESYTNEANLRP